MCSFTIKLYQLTDYFLYLLQTVTPLIPRSVCLSVSLQMEQKRSSSRSSRKTGQSEWYALMIHEPKPVQCARWPWTQQTQSFVSYWFRYRVLTLLVKTLNMFLYYFVCNLWRVHLYLNILGSSTTSDRRTMHPKFDLTGLRTRDLQVITVHFTISSVTPVGVSLQTHMPESTFIQQLS